MSTCERGKYIEESYMKLYILTFMVGLRNGHESLLGIYDTKEKVEEVINKHMSRNFPFDRDCYYVNTIKLNEEVDITIADW